MASDTAKLMQFMLTHGCVPASELLAFLSALKRSDGSQMSEENMSRSVENVNDRIKNFNMMIRSAYYDKTRTRYYALISTVDNEITRKASHHTEKEFHYFRSIWQRLVEAKDSSTDGNQSPPTLKDMYTIGKDLKLPNYKELVEEWSKKYWLHIEGNDIDLGPRAKLELDVLI
uniref:Non-structural maintenance of chromosomes element 1 homolog n=1 Tax=Aceria tosichella TaxID=561515 RepID=A0A6G1SPE0_9ACAR